jgi:hypothetical protein
MAPPPSRSFFSLLLPTDAILASVCMRGCHSGSSSPPPPCPHCSTISAMFYRSAYTALPPFFLIHRYIIPTAIVRSVLPHLDLLLCSVALLCLSVPATIERTSLITDRERSQELGVDSIGLGRQYVPILPKKRST